MAAGEAFTPAQRLRIDRATAAAAGETGIRMAVYVGGLDGLSGEDKAEQLLAQYADPTEEALIIVVAPADRVVQVATTASSRERLSDHACALACLSMTTSFGVGDIVGGVVSGLRILADTAGHRAMPGSTAEQLNG